MRATAILPLAFCLLARADDVVDPKKVPSACTSVCAPPQQLARLCDGRKENIPEGTSDRAKEQQEQQCICDNRSFDAARFFGLCASCLEQNVGRAVADGALKQNNVDDVNKHMESCGWGPTPFTDEDARAGDGIQVSLDAVSTASGSPTATAAASSSSGAVGTDTKTQGAKTTAHTDKTSATASATNVVKGAASYAQASAGAVGLAVAAFALLS